MVDSVIYILAIVVVLAMLLGVAHQISQISTDRSPKEKFVPGGVLSDMSHCLPCNCKCICKHSNNSECLGGCEEQCR